MPKKAEEIEKPSFESCIKVIDEEISKKKTKWRLTSIAWMDFDDVSQKIRMHIFNKWDQWDFSRPLRPWLSRIITNQITNLIRNNYSSFIKPCSQCKYNQGGDLCEIYGTQNETCEIYAKWNKGKKNAHEIKMPISIHGDFGGQDGTENKTLDIRDSYNFINYEENIEKFHAKIKQKLTNLEWMVYNYLYVENKSENETAKLMGYRTTEKNRSPGYKQIKKIKNKIYKVAKLLVLEIN